MILFENVAAVLAKKKKQTLLFPVCVKQTMIIYSYGDIVKSFLYLSGNITKINYYKYL